MREAEKFIREYYVELSKYSSDFRDALDKEKDRQEIFDRAYKGNESDREYVKKHMKRVLTDKSFRQVKKDSDFIVDDRNVDVFLNLREVPEDRFRVLLHDYSKKHGKHAFHEMIVDHQFYEKSVNKDIGVITAEMIHQAYVESSIQLDYQDKLEILVQKLYENFKGFPVIDNLIYQNIEDIQVGVSGQPEEAHRSIWIVIDGRLCHLEFLNLKDEAQLEDVCRKIAGDEKIDFVSPYAFAFGEDGSRRVSFKKDFSETWCGIIRKLNTVENMYNKDLLKASGVKNYKTLMLLEELLMKASISTVLIGDQGSGKTVKTVRLIEYIYDDYSVRTINNNFEGSARRLFPWKNIIEWKETEHVDENEAYEASLKSSGKVTIFTEIRKNHMIESFLNTGRRGSKFALTSMHHNEARKVPYELAKGLMKDGLHRQISDAIEDVLEVLKIVEEVVVTEDGRRVYNIYELRNITPQFESNVYKSIDSLKSTEDVMKVIAKSLVKLAQPVNYEVVPIVAYDKTTDSYIKKNDLSDELIFQMQRNIKSRNKGLIDDFKNMPRIII